VRLGRRVEERFGLLLAVLHGFSLFVQKKRHDC
jgi:hypothetical protein